MKNKTSSLKALLLATLLIIILFIIAGCSEVIEEPEEQIFDSESFCYNDNDCVPKPGCHPRECINSKFVGDYEQPEFCTMIYDYQAAYSEEDCLCTNNECVNINIGRGIEHPVDSEKQNNNIEEYAMSLEEAYDLAMNSETCNAEGIISEEGFFNENSKTWWFDLETFEKAPGCNPACVVLENNLVEINWRCTGLLGTES